jgi:hypothetical protein
MPVPTSTRSSSTPSPSPSPETGQKRGFINLLNNLTETGRKKPKRYVTRLYAYIAVLYFSNSDLSNAATSPYTRAGQWFTRSYSPFMNVTTAFHFGVRDGLPEDTEDDDSTKTQVYSHCMLYNI